MDGGKISVIVPCYNIEKYVKKTVQSILAQTYQNIEILLVDDGSTDETPDIIDNLAREYAGVNSYHKENGGVSSARLLGIDNASGEWITFVDGDDLLKPNMYAELMNTAIMYDADISHCGYEMVFSDHIDQYYGTGRIVKQNSFEGLRDLLSGQFIEPSLVNKLYKRDLVRAAYTDCAKNQNIQYLEDLLWNYYFFKRASSSIYVDKCFYQYVLRKGSASMAKADPHKVLDPIRVFKIIINDTCGQKDLQRIVKVREIIKLIDLSTMETTDAPAWKERCVKRATFILKKDRYSIYFGEYNLRIKVMVFLASISPGLYSVVRKTYSKFRGTDHRYDI